MQIRYPEKGSFLQNTPSLNNLLRGECYSMRVPGALHARIRIRDSIRRHTERKSGAETARLVRLNSSGHLGPC